MAVSCLADSRLWQGRSAGNRLHEMIHELARAVWSACRRQDGYSDASNRGVSGKGAEGGVSEHEDTDRQPE